MSAALISQLKKSKSAAKVLRSASTHQKNLVLEKISKILTRDRNKILKANAQDLKKFPKSEAFAFVDRLTLNPERLELMAQGARQVCALTDPVGEVTETRVLPNGISVKRVRSPLGVVFLIFESRPNVAIEAFTLALKSGNAMILRGGKESMKTTQALYQVIYESLAEAQLPSQVLWGITDADRKIPQFLMKQSEYIDVVVPRGGLGLIDYVVKNSAIPIIKNDRGLCHVYVHEDADLAMAAKIIENGKCSRPGVCNSIETVLVNEKVADKILPELFKSLKVEWRGCSRTVKIIGAKKAKPKDWDTEYLDFILNCKIVDSLPEAISHIEAHGSRHSEVIVTRSLEVARQFEREIDAAAVYWNASSRFTDGFELGLGGELGISTQKLHVRGPVGLRELTSVRWILEGTGQVRS